MYKNIGQKIMFIASLQAWIGIIASIIGGVYLLVEGEIATGILVIIAGSGYSWAASIILYGFGKLIDNTDKIVISSEFGFGELIENTDQIVANSISEQKK